MAAAVNNSPAAWGSACMSVRVRIRQSEVGLRTRTFLAWCVASLALAACAPAEHDPRSVFSKDLEVDGTTPAVADLPADAGTYLVEIREQDIDLRLVVQAPGSEAGVEDQVPRHGVLDQVVTLKSRGALRVEVHSADHRTKKGSARLSIALWKRAADAPATERELGYVALAA